jgi:hypothetical protein
MWHLFQGSIIVGVVAHEYTYGWNTSGNRLVPGFLGAVAAFVVTYAWLRIRGIKGKLRWW